MPQRANCKAASRPIPELEPVISMRFPFREEEGTGVGRCSELLPALALAFAQARNSVSGGTRMRGALCRLVRGAS